MEVAMAKEKRKYEPAFKAEAVGLVREQGRSVAEVAKSLDVHVNTLHGWVRESAMAGKRVHRSESDEQVRHLDGVMLGRAAYHDSAMLTAADGHFPHPLTGAAPRAQASRGNGPPRRALR